MRPSRQRGALSEHQGRWSLRIRRPEIVEGKLRIRTTRHDVGPLSKFRTKEAARLEADRLLERMGLRHLIGKTIAFEAFAKLYLEDQEGVLEATTLFSYRSYIRRHLVPHFKGKQIHEIAGREPPTLVTALIKKGLKRETVKACMSVLGRMLDIADRQGFACTLLNRRAYTLPRRGVRPEPRCITPEEAKRIIEAAAWPWRAFYALMAHAGLRCSEALALEWRHIDWVNKLIRVRQATAYKKVKDVKSRNSAADLPMSDALRAILAEFSQNTGPQGAAGGLLFPSPRGGCYRAGSIRDRHFVPLLKHLGIPHAGLHAFRHGCATNLFTGGASAPVVRSILRHGDIKTTLRYTHVTGEDQRRAARAASDLLSAA